VCALFLETEVVCAKYIVLVTYLALLTRGIYEIRGLLAYHNISG
jgi:hypothetical protein